VEVSTYGDFAFYAWADKPYLIAALRLGGTCWPDAAIALSIYPPKLVAGIAAA